MLSWLEYANFIARVIVEGSNWSTFLKVMDFEVRFVSFEHQNLFGKVIIDVLS